MKENRERRLRSIVQRAERMAHSVDHSENAENSNALRHALCALLLNPQPKIEKIQNRNDPKSQESSAALSASKILMEATVLATLCTRTM